MWSRLSGRWRGRGGCREVLRLAVPLILSTGAHTVQMFIDRVFLMWHGAESMSAALQAGIASFAVVAFFLGVATYVNTFVAQYTGADRPERVGPAVWQGVWFSLFAGVVMLGVMGTAEDLFAWMGHAAEVQAAEKAYFRIMCLGAAPVLIGSTLSCFYTGRGKTWVVMVVNVLGCVVNIVLDYCLIFGNWGFPAWGIEGAAWATVASAGATALVYLGLFLRREYRGRYNSLRGWRPEVALFGRLMRYGLPNGVQFMLDMVAFALFVAFVGRIDTVSLAATSMAFQINTLAFMPMIGMGMAVSVLVGQALGANDPALAVRSTWSAAYMTFGYMVVVSLGYITVPEVFIYPFAVQADPAEFAAVKAVSVKLLYFVAFYCLFDTGNIIFSAALKGAGDTRFVMVVSVGLSWGLMALPCYLAVRYGWGLYVAWGFATSWVCTLSVVFLLRFLQGRWKGMRVIEAVVPPVPVPVPEVPTVEVEAS